MTDPDNIGAEFGIVVRSDLKGGGLGERLMRKLIQHFRARGTQRLEGSVLRENERMLQLARDLGFTFKPWVAGDDVQHIGLNLQAS